MKTLSAPSQHPTRRQFVRTFVLGTTSTVVGTPWIGTLLATLMSAGRASAAPDGQLVLQVSSFPALSQAGGSVRVSVDPIAGAYPAGDFYPIVITRGSGNTFYAVSSQCPHRACVTEAYNGTSIYCPCHGSEFTMDGTFITGPAQADLARYPISFDGVNTLRVTVPGLGYSITSYTLTTGATPRIRLDFPTLLQVQYEVRFRQNATDAWTVVPFATTSTGPANNNFLTGDGAPKSVWVNRTTDTGFYSIAIRILEV